MCPARPRQNIINNQPVANGACMITMILQSANDKDSVPCVVSPNSSRALRIVPS